MTIHTKYFPSVMTDNEITYLHYLEGIIDSVDELSTLEIIKNPENYHFRLAPSLPKYSDILLRELLNFHNMFKIHLELSKSIKTGANITFQINLEN